MLHIYTLFFLLWQPSSNCNVSSFQKVRGVWTGGLLQVSTKNYHQNLRKHSEQLRFQGKLDLKWEGSIKNIRPPLMESLMLSKHQACARIFEGTTIKTDANHGIQVQNYHHHTAPPSPPITSNIPVPTRKNRHATFQSMLQFFQHWLWALMTCQSTRRICSHGSCPGKSCCFMCRFISYFIFLRLLLTFHTWEE